jgi:hypothetical protein
VVEPFICQVTISILSQPLAIVHSRTSNWWVSISCCAPREVASPRLDKLVRVRIPLWLLCDTKSSVIPASNVACQRSRPAPVLVDDLTALPLTDLSTSSVEAGKQMPLMLLPLTSWAPKLWVWMGHNLIESSGLDREVIGQPSDKALEGAMYTAGQPNVVFGRELLLPWSRTLPKYVATFSGKCTFEKLRCALHVVGQWHAVNPCDVGEART